MLNISKLKTVSAASKCLLLLATAILLLHYNLTYRSPIDSRLQREYVNWLSLVEKTIRDARTSEHGSMPELLLDLQTSSSSNSRGHISFKLKSSDNKSGNLESLPTWQKAQRLLELAREGRLFAVTSSDEPPGDVSYQLTITGLGQSFSQAFSLAQVRDRPAALNFLKLLEIYGNKS